MEINLIPFVTILGMAAATYATRVGGLWLMGQVRPTRRVEAWLGHIPGAILIAIVAPAIVEGGLPAALAALATGLAAWRTGNLFVAMAVGVVAVWGARLLLGFLP